MILYDTVYTIYIYINMSLMFCRMAQGFWARVHAPVTPSCCCFGGSNGCCGLCTFPASCSIPCSAECIFLLQRGGYQEPSWMSGSLLAEVQQLRQDLAALTSRFWPWKINVRRRSPVTWQLQLSAHPSQSTIRGLHVWGRFLVFLLLSCGCGWISSTLSIKFIDWLPSILCVWWGW